MPLNSRTKGKVGEREWAEFLRLYGFDARRGQQFSGGNESPDVVCDGLPIHWEVKRVQNLNLAAAYAQARRDAPQDKAPIVAHRKNRGEWMVTLSAADFAVLMGWEIDEKELP
jgi:Holliday junction resolvase